MTNKMITLIKNLFYCAKEKSNLKKKIEKNEIDTMDGNSEFRWF